MAHPVKHFITITKHRHRVMRHCFLAGIPFQGLFHDLSKYSLTEFIPGAKYYLGDRSPNEAERAEKGYSAAWLHHKGRNRHHLRPTYRLLIGIPGKSNAFAISGKLGLPRHIIEDARSRISQEAESFEDVISSLEESRKTIEKEQAELQQYKEKSPH